MASTLSGFFQQNARQVDNVKFVLTDRFIDPETGKPYEWEMRPLGAKEEIALRSSCMITTSGKNGRKSRELDTEKYTTKAVAATVVFPNLNDKELQDTYGVLGADELLQVMLLSVENAKLTMEFNKLNNYNTAMEELIDEAKD